MLSIAAIFGLFQTQLASAAPMDLRLADAGASALSCEPLVSQARSCNIPLEGIDPPGQTNELNPGDTITALVTLFEKGDRRTHWLLYLQVLEEDKLKPAPKPRSPMVLHSSRGNKLEFSSTPVRASLRTVGPFRDFDGKRKAPRVLDQKDHFFLEKEFLGLGFDQAAAAILRIRALKVKGAINFSAQPFPEADVQRGRQVAETVQLADAEERALAGAVPALISYFEILQHASGLEELASKIIARPSLWSMVRHRGVTASIWFRNQDVDVTPETGAFGLARYQFPMAMDLNDQRALNVTLFVKEAHSPWLVCGGVVGLLAEKPDDKATYLTIRVISARRVATKR